MAQSERLPIYKRSYDLCLYLEQVVRGFSRYHKYTLGADLREGRAALTPSPLAGEGRDGGMRPSSARKLRKHPTDAERRLWCHLRLRQLGGYKFRRQQPLGPYIVDFVCLEQRLCVEVDGGHHAEQAEEDVRSGARGWKRKASGFCGSGIQRSCKRRWRSKR